MGASWIEKNRKQESIIFINSITMKKQMKYIHLFALLLLLVSCSSLKKIDRSNVKVEVKTETEKSRVLDEKKTIKVSNESDEVTVNASANNQNENVESETRTIVYDTSKPVLALTGKPPVQSETTTTNRKVTQTSNKGSVSTFQKKNLKFDENSDLKQNEDSLSKVGQNITQTTEKKEVPKNNWFRWIVIGACLPFLIWGVIKFKWYKLLLPK